MSDDFFSGPERLDTFLPLNKPMRMASPQNLEVPDYEMTANFLTNKDKENALKLLTLLQGSGAGMNGLLTQWAAYFPIVAKNYLDDNQLNNVIEKSYIHFCQKISSLNHDRPSAKIIELAQVAFSPSNMTPKKAQELIEKMLKQETHQFSTLFATFGELIEQAIKATQEENWSKGAELFAQYYTSARTLHDCLVQFSDSFPATVAQQYGQDIAEKIVDESFKQAPFYGPLWNLAGSLNPKQLAAFLLEHLRDHFSGETRQGSAQVVEHPDRYQLIFKPCGSGGALRRRNNDDQYKLPKASCATFGLEGQVPSYCTHCAFNARTSIEKFGFPIYVTEFNPDPNKPCGWTIYKGPELIPDKYFENVGFKNDPNKYKKNYWKQDKI